MSALGRKGRLPVVTVVGAYHLRPRVVEESGEEWKLLSDVDYGFEFAEGNTVAATVTGKGGQAERRKARALLEMAPPEEPTTGMPLEDALDILAEDRAGRPPWLS